MQNTLTPHQMGKLAHFLGVANNFKHHLKTTSRHHTFNVFLGCVEVPRCWYNP